MGDNRKLLIFALCEMPEMARGQGVILQRYKDGGLADAVVFEWKDGLTDDNNRNFPSDELKEWKGERAQAGRIVPRGWSAKQKNCAPSGVAGHQPENDNDRQGNADRPKQNRTHGLSRSEAG